MVIFFSNSGGNTREVTQAEHNVMTPTFPENMSLEEKVIHYKNEELRFVSLPYEIGGDIFNYNALVDTNDNFIGLQPEEVL
ncbi:hypothetical protein [Clostridium sp.]|uniref:hypothetical protein n=1 Tax=Clostridium sp. TaxID=1506 RepID=UPI003217D214